jgi:hypothetical protein
MHHQGTAKLLLIGMVIQDNFFPGIIPMSKPKLPQANMLSQNLGWSIELQTVVTTIGPI